MDNVQNCDSYINIPSLQYVLNIIVKLSRSKPVVRPLKYPPILISSSRMGYRPRCIGINPLVLIRYGLKFINILVCAEAWKLGKRFPFAVSNGTKRL
jgi:hypothetical protein